MAASGGWPVSRRATQQIVGLAERVLLRQEAFERRERSRGGARLVAREREAIEEHGVRIAEPLGRETVPDGGLRRVVLRVEQVAERDQGL
jgi:hypothetical protein